MRNTKQKDLVFNIINTSYDHLTAKETYLIAKDAISNISLGTVYRILNELADNHKILRIMTKSGIDHFDRIPQNKHYHFICDNCFKIIDVFKCDVTFDQVELANYQIDSYDVTFSGLCNECTKEGKK